MVRDRGAAARRRRRAGFGAARGKNLIVVQVESLQDFVVDFQVGGQHVMPHLRRWAQTSLRFTNVTDQTSEGRTSDAEFTTMTSLLPLDHGAVAFRYPSQSLRRAAARARPTTATPRCPPSRSSLASGTVR